MSLLEKEFEPFVILNKAVVSDGVGGTITTWTDGATINAVSRLDNSTEARIAQQQGVTALYTLVTRKSVILSRRIEKKERRKDFPSNLRRRRYENARFRVFRL